MKGIEKITARIEADAQAEVEEILRSAREKAEEIRAGYEAQAQAEAADAAQSREKAAQQRLERLEGAAEMEAKRQTLAAKQACIDETFAKAQADLLALPEEKYAELLAKLAVKAAKTGREEIILSSRDRERVGTKVVAKANAMLAKSVAPQSAGGAQGEQGRQRHRQGGHRRQRPAPGHGYADLGRRDPGDGGRPYSPGRQCGGQLRL